MQIPKTTMAEWSFLHRAFYRFFPILLLPRFMKMYFKFEIHNKNYLNNFPEGIPIIYCINHRSHLDGFIAGSAIVVPNGPRTRIALMGAGNIMQENWFFRLAPQVGAFPIYPKKSHLALNYSIELLKKGVGIIIAPQGKRIIETPYHDYFNLSKEGKSGVGRLILTLNGKIPVIPAYIHGAAEALLRGQIIPRFGSYISVSFGPPIFWDKYTRKKGWKHTDRDFYPTARKITNKIMEKIRDQMIIQEKPIITLLEHSFGASIDEIYISPKNRNKFDKLVFKLLRTHPKQIQQYIKSKYNEKL